MDSPEQQPQPNPDSDPEKDIEKKPELWLDLYGDILFRDAMVRLGDRAAASDAVQEALLAAIKAVRDNKFDGRVKFINWLRVIVRNKAIDQIRRRVRERPFDTTDTEGISETLLYKLTGIPTTQPDNWAFDLGMAFEKEEFWGAFEVCMSNLTDVQRSVFTMKILDEISTQEICETLSISTTNLGVLLYRARQALKLCLEGKWFVKPE